MLFKYLPSERVDVLENLKIRFSPLMSLNDPFEFQPLVDMSNKGNQLLEEMSRGLEELWENADSHEKNTENRKILDDAKIDLIEHLRKETSAFVVGQGVISCLSDNFCVLSLSRTKKNLLMWSHYAEEGKGIVIGFDADHVFFKQPDINGKPTKPIPVMYSVKRSIVVPNEDSFYQKLMCEKPCDWSYEEEERIFRFFLSKEQSVGKDAYGMDIILSDLPKEAIKSIYLGYQVSDSTKNKVLLAIKNKKMICKVYQARVSLSEYKIEFDELDLLNEK